MSALGQERTSDPLVGLGDYAEISPQQIDFRCESSLTQAAKLTVALA
jgi:hypothetical protein